MAGNRQRGDRTRASNREEPRRRADAGGRAGQTPAKEAEARPVSAETGTSPVRSGDAEIKAHGEQETETRQGSRHSNGRRESTLLGGAHCWEDTLFRPANGQKLPRQSPGRKGREKITPRFKLGSESSGTGTNGWKGDDVTEMKDAPGAEAPEDSDPGAETPSQPSEDRPAPRTASLQDGGDGRSSKSGQTDGRTNHVTVKAPEPA